MVHNIHFKYLTLIGSIIITSVFYSCSNTGPEVKYVYKNTSAKGELIADTIIYDVIVKNRDSLDSWKDETLKHFNRQDFIDSLFTLVYSGKAKAIDLFTGEQLSIKEVKHIEAEEGYSRENIGKIQFREKWYFNSVHQIMQKEVFSIVIGVEDYSESGEFKGYAPVFKLDLN